MRLLIVQYQILQTYIMRIAWQIVRRIMRSWELKGKEHFEGI